MECRLDVEWEWCLLCVVALSCLNFNRERLSLTVVFILTAGPRHLRDPDAVRATWHAIFYLPVSASSVSAGRAIPPPPWFGGPPPGLNLVARDVKWTHGQ